MNLLEKAKAFSKLKHGDQKDDCGLNYFKSHIEGVVLILMPVTTDQEILAAAYLHDTIEDTDTSYLELKSAFGERVADLVNEVTHEGTNDHYGYYFPRLKSRDGIMIKLADRLSNISRMES